MSPCGVQQVRQPSSTCVEKRRVHGRGWTTTLERFQVLHHPDPAIGTALAHGTAFTLLERQSRTDFYAYLLAVSGFNVVGEKTPPNGRFLNNSLVSTLADSCGL